MKTEPVPSITPPQGQHESLDYLQKHIAGLSQETAELLGRYIEPVFMHDNSLKVLQRFIIEENLNAVAIVDEGRRPVGMIDRGKLIEIFVRPFAKDLHHKSPINQFMDKQPVIVDIHTGLDDLAQIILDAGMRHMVNGFILVQNEIYAGLGTGHDLLQEITRQKQQHLFRLAHYDQLTGLPNRLLFRDHLEQACEYAKRKKGSVGLIFADLDKFKYINDTMGHPFGDKLLKAVAKLFLGCVRACDTVARLGGDEFVFVITEVGGENDAEKVCQKIIATLDLPINIDGKDIQATASLGFALYPQHDATIDGLISKADTAMYAAKQQGRNAYQSFSPALSHIMLERMSIETKLKTAMENRELSLFYQPQIDLSGNGIAGVEALVRWHHPDLGWIRPGRFIPVAEEIGLIVPLGEWILREACRQQCEWVRQGLPPLRVAVNISAIQFRQEGFVDAVKSIITCMDIGPQMIELELTESSLMSGAERNVNTLFSLRNLGIRIAIDDFGTGFSSLSYLRKFPLDRIKIDQSFVRFIHADPTNAAIVRTIIALANNMGLEVIAEGIETQQEMDFIKACSCHEAQGYYFSKPLTADDFREWLVLRQCRESTSAKEKMYDFLNGTISTT
jgi:diguanylate cyclase (GGDEF)-like protein